MCAARRYGWHQGRRQCKGCKVDSGRGCGREMEQTVDEGVVERWSSRSESYRYRHQAKILFGERHFRGTRESKRAEQ